jgi:tricorn protease
MKRRVFLAAVLAVIFIMTTTAVSANADGKRYIMRFPDVHKDTVVFVYGEDIWKAPINGGNAVKLTVNDGQERFPKFSPDGSMIAFTGDYDGNSDVYVMNPEGGNITRVTYHPAIDNVVGWHPVKNKIIFSSSRESFSYFKRLFLISPDGTGLEPLILNEATSGSFSPDGSKIAYTKVEREFRTWKRYMGGTAQDIFVYDLINNTDTNITNFKGTDRMPMWIGDTVYFTSDRNYTLNIFAYDTKSEKTEQLTFHDDYDVLWTGDGGDKIVYEKGGELWTLDIAGRTSKKIDIVIGADAPEVRPYLKDVKDYITAIDISPSAKRAVITARGEVFTVPKKNGSTRNLTADPGARDKDAVWSPDGKFIAFLSDKDGEYNIYIVNPDGKSAPIKLTDFKNGYRHSLEWSPDSKKIAFADQTLRFYFLDIDSKKITEVDRAGYENIDVSQDIKPIYDFTWSPDSRYLAYSKMDADLVNKLYIFSLETGKIHCVSSGLFNDFQPVFTNDGEHLVFVSNRRFNPTFCDFEWEMVFKDMAGLYALTLRKDGKALLPFRSDEEGEKNDEEEDDDDKDKKKPPVTVTIDFDGIAARIEALPIPKGNYRYPSVNDDAIFFLNAKKGDFNRFEFRPLGPMDLYAFDLKERKETLIRKEIDSYKISFDGSFILCKKDNEIGMIDLEDEDNGSDGEGKEGFEMKALDLSGLKMFLDPRKEWLQIFNESWRLERDFYYDPKMKGIDWAAVGEKYRKLLPAASCRQDLQFLVGEMIGELSTSHTYVYGGDRKQKAESVNIGMLGVDWGIHEETKRYFFKKIYRVPDWSREVMPPLAGPGINIKEGDFLLAVNGKPVTADRNIYSYFQDLAGKQVTLTVNNKPVLPGAKEYAVKPLNSEYQLRYLAWVEHNRLTAEKESNGQIGYIHFPDTFEDSAIEFPKYFYSQLTKKGIIVDGRFNGGGLDPDIFLSRLDKKINSYWTRRYSHHQQSPAAATRAHLVCLTNRQAGSGGDEFPMLFRKKGMGPVIGTRTWGGLVGVSMFLQMVDGGGLTAPDYRIYDENGRWIIENLGVVPDFEVDLHPAEVARGYDAQLMKGIEILKKKIEEDPRPWPRHDPWPVDKK